MDLFYALAEPRRRTVIELLASRGAMPATEICAAFDVSPQAISQHLKVLRESNVLQMEKWAQMRIYSINPDALMQVEGWTRKMTQLWSERFDRLDELLEEQKKSAPGSGE